VMTSLHQPVFIKCVSLHNQLLFKVKPVLMSEGVERCMSFAVHMNIYCYEAVNSKHQNFKNSEKINLKIITEIKK